MAFLAINQLEVDFVVSQHPPNKYQRVLSETGVALILRLTVSAM